MMNKNNSVLQDCREYIGENWGVITEDQITRFTDFLLGRHGERVMLENLFLMRLELASLAGLLFLARRNTAFEHYLFSYCDKIIREELTSASVHELGSIVQHTLGEHATILKRFENIEPGFAGRLEGLDIKDRMKDLIEFIIQASETYLAWKKKYPGRQLPGDKKKLKDDTQ